MNIIGFLLFCPSLVKHLITWDKMSNMNMFNTKHWVNESANSVKSFMLSMARCICTSVNSLCGIWMLKHNDCVLGFEKVFNIVSFMTSTLHQKWFIRLLIYTLGITDNVCVNLEEAHAP